MRKVVIALMFCSSSVVYANSACDAPKDDFDGLYCLNKVYQEADKELNENYKALSGKLDRDGRKTLKTTQLAWMGERNSRCSRSDTSGFYVNLNCATTLTIARSQSLRDRVRECASSGCQNSKLKD